MFSKKALCIPSTNNKRWKMQRLCEWSHSQPQTDNYTSLSKVWGASEKEGVERMEEPEQGEKGCQCYFQDVMQPSQRWSHSYCSCLNWACLRLDSKQAHGALLLPVRLLTSDEFLMSHNHCPQLCTQWWVHQTPVDASQFTVT